MPKNRLFQQDLRIAFAGTPDFAAIHLQALINQRCQIVGVFTQPDRPAGRGKKLNASPVKELAEDNHLTVFQPKSFKEPDAQQALENLAADILIVVAYGLIIPKQVLSIPKYGCINVHASLLPRWRGAAPIQRAIEAGDTQTGVTIMQMDEGLDTGDMLFKASCEITTAETGGSLHDKLALLGPPALLSTLQAIATSNIQPIKQDNNKNTYAPKITKKEAEIDWTQPSSVIDQKIRAFNPFPISYTSSGEKVLRIWKANPSTKDSRTSPGTIIDVSAKGIVVCCGSGALTITEAQLPGKKRLPVADILRGNSPLFPLGQHLGANNP